MAHLYIQDDTKVSVGGSNDNPATIPTPIQLGSLLVTYAATGPTGQTAAGYAALAVSGTPQWVPFGAPGPAGATGPSGSAGATGPTGSVSDFGMFYGLTTGTGNGGATDYAATIAARTVAGSGRVPFPRNGPTSGAAVRVDGSSFTIPAGTWEVTFRLETTEPGQLQLEIDGVAVDESTTVDQNPTAGGHLMVSTTIVTRGAPFVLAVINPSGNSPALTVTPADGASTHANVGSLTLVRLA